MTQTYAIQKNLGASPQLYAPFPGYVKRNDTALEIITSLGLTGNLQLCLDTGDASSFTSGDKWLDRSGNGFDFYRGTSVSGDGAEPTFNGTAGAVRNTEYFSFDGGDYFTYDTTNETWMQNIHKDNAAFTLMTWFYHNGAATQYPLAGTGGTSTAKIGFDWYIQSGRQLYIEILKGAGGASLAQSSTNSVATASAWNMAATSINEASATGIQYMNGLNDSFTSTYTTPSASSATHTMQIGSDGNSTNIVGNGYRMAIFCAWSTALTLTQLDALYGKMRGRFGI